MALALVPVGTDYWVNPQRYLPMMPPWIPLHLELVHSQRDQRSRGRGLPQARWYYWLRLPFQPIAILWALYAAEALTLRKLRGLSRGGWRA
jgi:uncharacterized membrane protein